MQKKSRLSFRAKGGSATHVAKKQCKLFQLFCSFSKPREVDTKSTYLNLVRFFVVELECHKRTVRLCLIRLCYPLSG